MTWRSFRREARPASKGTGGAIGGGILGALIGGALGSLLFLLPVVGPSSASSA